MATKSKGILNRLNQIQTAQFGNWLITNVNRLKQENVSYKEAGKQASQELGFPITVCNVTAFAAGLSLDWVGDEKRGGKENRKGWKRLHDLEEAVEALKHDREVFKTPTAINERLLRVENDGSALLELVTRQIDALREDLNKLKDAVAGMERNQGPYGELRDLVHHLYRTLGENPPQGYNIPGCTSQKQVPEPIPQANQPQLRGGLNKNNLFVGRK